MPQLRSQPCARRSPPPRRADAVTIDATRAKAEAAHAKAVLSGSEALIAHLRLVIEKLRREPYGQRSERKQRLLEQLELQLGEMEATASEDEALAEVAAAKAKVEVAAFARAKPVRKPFPEHLPRERVVLPAPCSCAACGSALLVRMGEDVTDTLDVIPRRWKVIQTVRKKFTCRDCERIGQPPAPFHPTPRGWAGPSLLAMIVGVLQADAYAGFNPLFGEAGTPAPITPEFCWAHSRRKFFELADIDANAKRGNKAPPISPLALEAVTCIDAVFDLERATNGLPAEQRLAVREAEVAPLAAALHDWMKRARAWLSRHAHVAKAMDDMLARWGGFTRFLADGRACLTNNAAERSLRGVALGRKAWLFAGSERGGDRAAFMYTLIVTAKLNGVDPQAWLADVRPHRRHADVTPRPSARKRPASLPWKWADNQKLAQIEAA